VADNLTISIGADTSKLRGEIELVEAQIQNLRRLARGALRKDDAAGAAEYTQQIGKLRTNLVGLNRTLEQTGAVAASTSRSMAVSARSFRSVDQAVLGLGRSLGGVHAGLAAFAAARVFSVINNQIEEYRKNLIAIRDEAQKTQQAPAAIKGAQDIAKGLGRSAEDATKMLGGVAEALAKVRSEAGAPVNPTGVKELRGGMEQMKSSIEDGVRELRGSSKIVFDLAKAYDLLGIKTTNYKGTQEDIRRLQMDTFAAFQKAAQQKLFDPVQLNELSKVLFQGLPADAALKIIPDLLKRLNDEIAKNAQLAPDIANQEALDAATARLTKMVDDQIAEHNRLWTAVQTASANALADFIQGIPAWVAGWEQWKQGNKAAVDDMVAYVEGAATRIANALSQAFAAAKQTLQQSFPGDPSIPAMPNGMAGGGLVSGPGTATSDSILARVSAGEYVMRARAVDHWGPRFMASLNALRSPFGFAGGGLVMPQRSLPRFADGGLVAAGGGTGRAVHLHLGGSEFALSGASNVVDALVTEASRQRMRSGGLKPSWYGGRVSG